MTTAAGEPHKSSAGARLGASSTRCSEDPTSRPWAPEGAHSRIGLTMILNRMPDPPGAAIMSIAFSAQVLHEADAGSANLRLPRLACGGAC